MKLKTVICLSISLLILGVACKKAIESIIVPQTAVIQSLPPQQLNFFCNSSPSYGDSVIYGMPGKSDYILKPVNAAALGSGKYFSWPTGLLIDSASGSIDISNSETGLRYVVGFVKQGTQDTCVSNLIIGGVTYVDSIYVLSANDTLAFPYFNANASIASPCDGSDDTDYPENSGKGKGNNKCFFDAPDKKGKSGNANGKDVKVRTISGIINLKATLNDGAFGSSPADGATVTVPVYYYLNNQSKNAPQVLNVQLLYYNKRSDIPLSVVNAIAANRAAFYQNKAILSVNPRPPVIIVTHYF